VLAGQGGVAKFIRNGEFKYITYNQLFRRLDRISIDGYGDFDGYANRDSLSYRATYGLETIPTIYRGTLRRAGFCEAYNIFIDLGMTDDTYAMENSENLSARSYLNAFLSYDPTMTVENKFKRFLGEERAHLFSKFEWLGFFDGDTKIGFPHATPAQMLEKILVSKWVLEPGDKDMLVMYHEFVYELNGKSYGITASMVNIGEDPTYTSMSNTVGLPAAIAAKMILNGTLHSKGVTLPIQKEVYSPILKELESFGITFIEKENII
jgi:saccharopine dehydrogenase-like NADP-dependent oxidoreductase